MNRTNIEWIDRTWSPVVGCTHECPFCYARSQAKRAKQRCDQCYEFIPHIHYARLLDINPRQRPQKISVGSKGDLFCPGVKPEWIDLVKERMVSCSQHTFLILTENPEAAARIDWPNNVCVKTPDIVRGCSKERRYWA